MDIWSVPILCDDRVCGMGHAMQHVGCLINIFLKMLSAHHDVHIIDMLDSPTSIDTTAVVAAMLTLWVINLFIPSIVGLIWHARHQSKRKSRMAKLGM